MLKIGDKIILKKMMGAFKNIGEKCEVTSVDNGVISFKFGNGLNMGCMSEDELSKYFDVESAPTVQQSDIDAIIRDSEIVSRTVFGKCTEVEVKLPCGFVIVETSACVSPENYDEELGYNICMDKIKDRLWMLEGYYLQKKLHEEQQQQPMQKSTILDW